MTLRISTLLTSLCLLASTTAMADDHEDSDFAEYGINLGVSPFGGSINFAHNPSEKTTIFATVGGLPEGAPGSELTLDIEGTEYTVNANSSWVGFFVNHRPLDNAQWFRVAGGIGIGSIENDLEDSDGNQYQADYNDNPVGYIGVGFGSQPKNGIQFGFDLGMLHTSGPDITGPDADAIVDISNSLFFGNILPNVQATIGWGF